MHKITLEPEKNSHPFVLYCLLVATWFNNISFSALFLHTEKGTCHFHVPPFHYRRLFHDWIAELRIDETRWVDLAHFSLLSTCFFHQNQQVAEDINVWPKSCIWLPAQLFNLNKNIKPYTTFVRMKPGEVSVRMFLLFCFVFN